MTAHRKLQIFSAVLVAAAALGVSAWLLGEQATELMNATAAAKAAKSSLAQEQARLQRTTIELTQRGQQAEQQADALQESIAVSQRYQQDQKQHARRLNVLSEGLAAAASVKVAVAEYFASLGKWPASNQEAGVAAPTSYKTDTLRRLTVEGHKITLVFDNAGTKERLLLHASVNPAGQISWRCNSPDIVDVAALIAQCTYDEEFGAR